MPLSRGHHTGLALTQTLPTFFFSDGGGHRGAAVMLRMTEIPWPPTVGPPLLLGPGMEA